jgi:hypothetical protein
MTMQSSGAISLAQAGAECGYGVGTAINESNNLVSELGNRAPGQALAWSYWYGQQYIAPIPYQLMVDYQAEVDQNFFMVFDYRTGGYSWSVDSSNNGAGLIYFTLYHAPIANAGTFTSFSGTIVAYNSRSPTTVTQAPSAGNDFTIRITNGQDGQPGAAPYGVYMYVEAHNRFG